MSKESFGRSLGHGGSGSINRTSIATGGGLHRTASPERGALGGQPARKPMPAKACDEQKWPTKPPAGGKF